MFRWTGFTHPCSLRWFLKTVELSQVPECVNNMSCKYHLSQEIFFPSISVVISDLKQCFGAVFWVHYSIAKVFIGLQS